MSGMKNLINFGLVLVCVFSLNGCKKKEEPPVVEEPKGVIKKTMDTAKEKASDIKESAGGALDKATDSAIGFKDTAVGSLAGLKDKAGGIIEKVKPGSDE